MPTYVEIFEKIRELQEDDFEKPFDAVRRYYLRRLNEITGRDAILYSTAWTLPGGGSDPYTSINNRDVHAFMEAIHGLESDELDLILHTPGGSAEATEQIVGYIRSKFEHLRIFVPQAAMSAGTLMCCAADEVVMGRHSSLGPIDPQFLIQTPFRPRVTPAFAILDQFEIAQDSVNTNADLTPWYPILQQYPPGLIAECKEAIQLSRQLAQEWASRYMHSDLDESEASARAETMADYLSNRHHFKSHSRRISIQEASEQGFNVATLEENQELQDAVLSVFHSAIHTHAARPVAKIIENQNQRTVIMQNEGRVTPGGEPIEYPEPEPEPEEGDDEDED